MPYPKTPSRNYAAGRGEYSGDYNSGWNDSRSEMMEIKV
jgi:hypothetical protein